MPLVVPVGGAEGREHEQEEGAEDPGARVPPAPAAVVGCVGGSDGGVRACVSVWDEIEKDRASTPSPPLPAHRTHAYVNAPREEE